MSIRRNLLRQYLGISIRSAINDDAPKIKPQITQPYIKRFMRNGIELPQQDQIV